MGEHVPSTRGGRLLGAHVAVRKGVKNELGEKRVQHGILVSDRIRWAPLPMQVRSRQLASLVMPSALYGFCVGGLTCYQIKSLTSAVMRAMGHQAGFTMQGGCFESVCPKSSCGPTPGLCLSVLECSAAFHKNTNGFVCNVATMLANVF